MTECRSGDHGAQQAGTWQAIEDIGEASRYFLWVAHGVNASQGVE